MQLQELDWQLDRLCQETERLQKALLVLGCALFAAYFLPWGYPGLGARWEMDLWVDVWPFVWAFAFLAVGAAKTLKLPYRPRPFGMGLLLLAFGGIGLLVVAFKLAGDGPGFVNALVLGTLPYLVTGALGHLGFVGILVGLYLQKRHAGWAPARWVALAGGGLLLVGVLVPGKTSGDAFPLTALFRQASGAEVLLSLYSLVVILGSLGLAALPILPKDKVPPALFELGSAVLLAFLPPAWLLYWILGPSGSWQDLYSIPHRLLTLVGLATSVCVGADLLVRALRSEAYDRFVPWDPASGTSATAQASPQEPGPGQPPVQGYAPPHEGYPSPQQGYPPGYVPQAGVQGYASPQQGYASPQQGYASPHEGWAQQPQGHSPYSTGQVTDPHPVVDVLEEAPSPSESPCPMCGQPLEWVGQYERWYCRRCSQYL